MTNATQAPHRLTYQHMAISPVNGMPLPSKREPDKRAGSLIISITHGRRYPQKLLLAAVDGTQRRDEPSQKARYGALPAVFQTLIALGRLSSEHYLAGMTAPDGSYVSALGPWENTSAGEGAWTRPLHLMKRR
jgi:hypothetical protein